MFGIFKVHQSYQRIVRGISIIGILLRFFIIDWMSNHRFLLGLIPAKFKRDNQVVPQPERLRKVIEELGPTFIKFGQILADRPDIISEKLRVELKKLQSRAKPFDNDLAFQLIEDELGGPVSHFFEEIEPNCFASASIGQVYRGRLKDGTPVVIKIQRPGIESKVKLDISLLRLLMEELVKQYPGLTVVDIVGFVDEFGEIMMHEMNYLAEASNARRFELMFRNTEYCMIPKVYMELTTRRLLVMEYVTGSPPDTEELVKRGLDPVEVAKNGTHIFLKMIFQHGFFHGDPHPGNFFIQENNRVALIDFGMTGVLKPPHMSFLANFSVGMATKNAAIITDGLLELCDKKFYNERNNLEFAVQDMLNRYSAYTYDTLPFSQMLNECVDIMLKFKLNLPSSIYLLIKTLATVEKVGYNLKSGISLAAMIRPYAENLVKTKYSPKVVAQEVYKTLHDYMDLIREFPNDINEILYKLKEGRLIHDLEFKADARTMRSLRNIGRIIAMTLLTGSLLAASIILKIWGPPSVISDVLFGISAFFTIWVILRLFFRSSL